MIKSLHIIGSRLLGGAESFYMRLVSALHQAGHPTMAMGRPDSRVVAELDGRVPLACASLSNGWDLLSRYKIAQLIKTQQPDIVQTYMTRATVLTHVPAGSHTLHVARLGGFYKLKRFAHADAWVGNTRAICDYLVQGGMPADRVFYIGNFVDRYEPQTQEQQRELRADLSLPDDAMVILSVGRMIEKKGFQDLLAAFALLPPDVNDRPLHLVLVGDGPMRAELSQMAASLDIAGLVHFAGWQTRTSPYYSLADIFVCPSRHEPLGNVILEAWSHSLPVVSTRSHGALELIEDERNGLLTPCADADALGQRLQEIVRLDENARQQLGGNGFTTIETDYRPESILEAYTELYQGLIQQR